MVRATTRSTTRRLGGSNVLVSAIPFGECSLWLNQKRRYEPRVSRIEYPVSTFALRLMLLCSAALATRPKLRVSARSPIADSI
jgi:hypothetical protein